MFNISLETTGHDWYKHNLMTKKDRKGMFDELSCKKCGIKGKSYQLGFIQIPEKYNREKVFSCPGSDKIEKLKKVKVTNCTASGKAFGNLIPGSVHEIVTPPEGYKNDHTGVWVMGVGEPVKLLAGEYTEQ